MNDSLNEMFVNAVVRGYFFSKLEKYRVIYKAVDDNINNIKTMISEMIENPRTNITDTMIKNDDNIIISIDKNSGDLNISVHEICHISAYENNHELTVPFSKMVGLDETFEYIENLYKHNVVSEQTYFIIRYNNNVFEVKYVDNDEFSNINTNLISKGGK
jgi:hypothetical protein